MEKNFAAEMEKEFLEVAKKNWPRILARRQQIERSYGKNQQKINEAMKRAELRENLDPELLKIEKKLRMKEPVIGGLVCPQCGDSDHGNKCNGKPWCFKCNRVLIEKAKKPFISGIRILSKKQALDRDFEKLIRG